MHTSSLCLALCLAATVSAYPLCADQGFYCGHGGCDVDDCCGTPDNPEVKDCCHSWPCDCGDGVECQGVVTCGDLEEECDTQHTCPDDGSCTICGENGTECSESQEDACTECFNTHCGGLFCGCAEMDGTWNCFDTCVEENGEDYMNAMVDQCEAEQSSSSSSSGSGNSVPSEECMTGCAKDCYGSMDFMNGDRWNKEQCVCLVTDCYDSRDCNDDDVQFLEEFVETGCGAEDSSYDYSYDYRDVEAIAAEESAEGDGVARAALASAAVVVGAALLF